MRDLFYAIVAFVLLPWMFCPRQVTATIGACTVHAGCSAYCSTTETNNPPASMGAVITSSDVRCPNVGPWPNSMLPGSWNCEVVSEEIGQSTNAVCCDHCGCRVNCWCPSYSCQTVHINGQFWSQSYSALGPGTGRIPDYVQTCTPIANYGCTWGHDQEVDHSGNTYTLGLYFCGKAVRGTKCIHGDSDPCNGDPYGTGNFANFFPSEGSGISCKCDCGWTGGEGTSFGCSTSTSTPTCYNPASSQNEVMAQASGSCPPPAIPGVPTFALYDGRCWCPSSTCTLQAGLGMCLGVGSSPNVNGYRGAWYGIDYYDDTYRFGSGFTEHRVLQCTEKLRDAKCNGNGDYSGSLVSPTQCFTGDVGCGLPATCTCDCGWSGGVCNNPLVQDTCTNLVTGNTNVVFTQTSDPSGTCRDPNNNAVRCWCPADTCTSGIVQTCNRVNGIAYTSRSYVAATLHANTFQYCTQNYRTAVCNGHGDSPSDSNIPWDAPFTNPRGPCVCDSQWFDASPTSRCSVFANCPHPRPGRMTDTTSVCGHNSDPSLSHGTCQANGQCACVNGWSGAACDSFCPNTGASNRECSGAGVCNLFRNETDWLVNGQWDIHHPFGAAAYSINDTALVELAHQIEWYVCVAVFQF